ncbi:MAG: ribosomal RNA small subunit methyltransferase A, partial [Acidobacteria bacterium]|nr:ribosomal RNA small subunit methyltransferase A [Acidobacteriota bacterium]
MQRENRRRRPKLGQHFLADAGVRARLLQQLMIRSQDCWLEIGSGHGEMTLALAQQSAQVVAVEKDASLARALREKLRGQSGCTVVEADILEVSATTLAQQFGVNRWRVYGNLPYYITSPILQRLFAALDVIADIHVVVQREVALRLTAEPGRRDYGYLSVLTQFYTTPALLEPIPRGAFQPPPKVESALVRLTPPGARERLAIAKPDEFLVFLQTCFRHKRKTLRINLSGAWPSKQCEATSAPAS